MIARHAEGKWMWKPIWCPTIGDAAVKLCEQKTKDKRRRKTMRRKNVTHVYFHIESTHEKTMSSSDDEDGNHGDKDNNDDNTKSIWMSRPACTTQIWKRPKHIKHIHTVQCPASTLFSASAVEWLICWHLSMRLCVRASAQSCGT